jgi:hypothetical protein
MPTIEIASISATGLGLNQADFDVAIIEENKLKSHRGLFSDLLQAQQGVIIHIGNPDMKGDPHGVFFAGEIIDWNVDPDEIDLPEFDPDASPNSGGATQQGRFKFLQEFTSDINKLLNIALKHSPIKKVFFLTDYQFGPAHKKIEINYTLSSFWAQHETDGLYFNTMYEIHG